MWAVVFMVLAQVACSPGDPTVVCQCKVGQMSACEVLRQSDPRWAAKVEKLVEQARALKSLDEVATTGADASTKVSGSSEAPEPPECKGQLHHVISRKIARALEQHPTLRRLYKARDPRFVAHARDEASHCGYQDWHRRVDDEVVEWLKLHDELTPKQFESFLRSLYTRPDLLSRFPRGF